MQEEVRARLHGREEDEVELFEDFEEEGVGEMRPPCHYVPSFYS